MPIFQQFWKPKNMLVLSDKYKLLLFTERPFLSSLLPTRCQLHQHFTCPFFIVQLLSNYSLALQFFWWKKIGPKAAREMLMKLTTGVNFINILCIAFMRADPKSAKIQSRKASVFFVLFESVHVKAACKMLMKLPTRSTSTTFGWWRPRKANQWLKNSASAT